MTKIDKPKVFLKTVTVLFLSAIVLMGCGTKSVSHEDLAKEVLTKEKGLYNLYFFGNDSSDSETIEKELDNRWIAEDYPMVYNARFYNISDPDYTPSENLLKYLELDEEMSLYLFCSIMKVLC